MSGKIEIFGYHIEFRHWCVIFQQELHKFEFTAKIYRENHNNYFQTKKCFLLEFYAKIPGNTFNDGKLEIFCLDIQIWRYFS